MFENIYNAEAIPGQRRCAFSLRNSADDTPYIGSVPAGTKAQLSLNQGTHQPSTNDVTVLDVTNFPGAVFVEFTLAELAAWIKGNLVGSVHGLTGVKTEDFQCSILPYDPWSASAPDVNVTKIGGHAVTGDGNGTPYDTP